MLFPPQFTQKRWQAAIESLQPVHGCMAGGAERRQPCQIVAPRFPVMHNVSRRAAHPAAAAVSFQNLFFQPGRMGFRMAGRIAAAGAQTRAAQFFALANEAA